MAIAIPLLLSTVASADSNNRNEVKQAMNYDQKILKNSLDTISKKKIYFGHQSVGYNMLDGVKSLIAGIDFKGLSINETGNPASIQQPQFAHSPNGKNTKPETKIKAFKETMARGMGRAADMAFFKFCYVDITAATDVEALFDAYKKTMDELIKSYPKVTFIHMTVPVTMEKTGFIETIKSLIKKIIGRDTGYERDNIRRMEFNTRLIEAYGSTVFDLARVESTKQDGTTVLSDLGGASHYFLLPQYTSDGGHLNSEGAQFVAYNFIRFLAEQ